MYTSAMLITKTYLTFALYRIFSASSTVLSPLFIEDKRSNYNHS